MTLPAVIPPAISDCRSDNATAQTPGKWAELGHTSCHRSLTPAVASLEFQAQDRSLLDLQSDGGRDMSPTVEPAGYLYMNYVEDLMNQVIT